MEIQKANGIVLGSRPLGEADRMVRVFTREFGKRSFLFKGIRKSKRRNTAATEAGTDLNLVYYFHDNRDFFIVNEFEVLRRRDEIRDDLEKILYQFFLLDVIDRTTGFNDPNRAVYDLLWAALGALVETASPRHLAVFFILHLLRIDGILPDFSACRRCGRRDFSGFVLDVSDMSPVCSVCAAGYGRHLSMTSMEYIRKSLATKFTAMKLELYDGDSMLDMLFAECMFIENYFHTRLKSKEMIFSGIA